MRNCHGDCGGGGERERRGAASSPFLTGAAAALGALLVVRNRGGLRPYLRTALREVIAFKEWLTVQAEEAKEDFEDMAAEAQDDYEKDLERRISRAESGLGSLKKLASQAKRRGG